MGGALIQVDIGHGRGWLEAEAAKSQARIDRALGHPQQITEAGRTWLQQKAHWDVFQRYGKPIALHPDTPSIHQLGRAKDTDERDVALMNDHGWFQTVYRVVNGVRTLVEPWHFEYDPARDNHRGEVIELINDNGTWRIAPETPALPELPEEENMLNSIYAQQSDGQKPDKDRIFAIFRDPRTGQLVKDHITDSGVWGAIVAAAKKAGLPRDGGTLEVRMTARALDKIPTWRK